MDEDNKEYMKGNETILDLSQLTIDGYNIQFKLGNGIEKVNIVPNDKDYYGSPAKVCVYA